jgi:membrane protein DedA with SNARE-associated domain
MESVIEWILAYRYLVIVPGAIIEGPILSIICGLLVRLDVLGIVPTYLFLMLGDLIGDTLWYFAGFYWGKSLVVRFGKYFSVTEQSLAIIEKLFHKYHSSILIISKVLMGFGFPGAVLATAGIVKLPFRKFIVYNTIGQIMWTGGLLAIGYYVGDAYLKINGGLGIFSLISVFILVIALLFGVGKYIRKRTLATYSESEQQP